ncbi:hypothetical protein BdWA1_001615 [Babesia duncani]|uniref:Uncharacterized protein n=1 Tax=Babesia duncani TaxID=323732 RepID=A0AAD9PK84_9APIC|nr:hypothetical protein BdWA1_001615 [Babesia duncani]
MNKYSNAKSCNGYPLKITLAEAPEASKVIPQELQPEFIKKMLQRLDYDAFYTSAASVSSSSSEAELQLGFDLPRRYDDSDLENERFIQTIHDAMLNVR